MIGNAVSELGSLIAMGMVESSDNRGGSVCCEVAVLNHQKQGRYNHCSKWQGQRDSQGDWTLRALWRLVNRTSIPMGEADGEPTTILLNLYN